MTDGERSAAMRAFACGVLALGLLPAIGVAGDGRDEATDPSRLDEHASWLGHRVLAIAAAMREPQGPQAMEPVLELGLDSRYYLMVRGWLVMQLSADRSIEQARGGDPSPEVAARIRFLEDAIRAIDLE